MSLLRDYEITYNKRREYILTFNTNQPASAKFTNNGATHVITLDNDASGTTNFTKNFGSLVSDFDFMFDQPDGLARKKKPKGTILG